MKQTRIFTPQQITDLCNYFTEIDGIIYHAGVPAKVFLNAKGYHRIACPPIRRAGKKYGCVSVYVSRLVWILHNKTNPDIIDHDDHIITNNKISNLRNVNHRQNSLNRKTAAGGDKRTSTYIGVSERKIDKGRLTISVNCWRARVVMNGIHKTIGHYPTAIEAAKARDAYIRSHAPASDLEYYRFNFPIH